MKSHEKQNASRVSFFHVGPEQEGQRIDNFLVTKLKGVPKSHIYRVLRKGEVRVNKGRVKPEYRLRQGDVVRVPPVRTATATPVRVSDTMLERIGDAILYEDNRLLIIDKPSGVAVHGGSGINFGVIEALRALRPDAKFLELVHRLDRDTSGCLIIAKRRSALRALHELLREGGMDKHYLALLKGRLKARRRVDAPLRKNVLSSGERMVRVDPDGKPAQSDFVPVEYYDGATLTDIRLLTGRTHQIRVHAAHIGHPLAGDEKYGDAEFNRALRDTAGLQRLFLHARSLSFTLPGTDDHISVTAPLSPDLEAALDRLK